jgi:alanine racemase
MEVIFQGKRLPQVGAITMDQLVIDATAAPDLDIGGVVTVLGSQGQEQITPADWSSRCDTIPWEVLCGFKRRLPRLEPGEEEWPRWDGGPAAEPGHGTVEASSGP